MNVTFCFSQAGAAQAPSVSLPLTFEVNRGQTAPQVQYLARSREGILFFTPEGFTVSVPRAGAFRVVFENAAPPEITAEQKLVARSNYLGRNAGKSITNVENYSAIRYSGLYPGIGVRFYGQGSHVEHDFLLAPGTGPESIVLRFEGLDHLALTQVGDAELTLGKSHLRETPPIAWQVVNGQTKAVPAHWKTLGDNRLGIELGEYDRNLAVTIDPVLVYSTHLGGTTGTDDNGDVFPASTGIGFIGLDSHRNVYVAGSTSATDFPTTAGAFDRTANFEAVFHEGAFSQSGFVSKFDPTGKILIYSTYLRVQIDAMTVSPEGHVYTTEEVDEETPGPSSGSDEGIFVDKLSLDGSRLAFTMLFAQNFDANCSTTFINTRGNSLVADSTGHLWMAGSTGNPCIGTAGTFQSKLPNPNQSGFVAKFNTNVAPSSAVTFVTYLGGSSGSGTSAQAITIDSSGDVYVAGSTDGNSFPHSSGFGTGQEAVFVIKLNASGSGSLASTLLHGAGNNFRGVGGIAIDTSHNMYVAGVAVPGFRTTTGAFQTTDTSTTSCTDNNGNPGPCDDGFVTKLSPSGGTLLYSTFLGGGGPDSIGGLAVNSAGMAFVAGTTSSTDFPTTPNAFKKTLPLGFTNAFVTALQPDGKSLFYSTLLGGSKSTTGGPIFVDTAWNAWVGGATSDADFPVTPDAFQPGMKGAGDGFFAKVVIAADLKVSMSQSATSVPRNTIVGFTATVTNLGPDGSDAVVLTDPIPAGFSFSSISGSTATSCSTPAAGATTGSVVCNKTRLEKGQSFGVKVNLKVIAASGSHVTNKATVSARTQDLSKSNNTAQASVAVQ